METSVHMLNAETVRSSAVIRTYEGFATVRLIVKSDTAKVEHVFFVADEVTAKALVQGFSVPTVTNETERAN